MLNSFLPLNNSNSNLYGNNTGLSAIDLDYTNPFGSYNSFINSDAYKPAGYIEKDPQKMSSYEIMINSRLTRGKLGSPTIADYKDIIEKAKKYAGYETEDEQNTDVDTYLKNFWGEVSGEELFGETFGVLGNSSPTFSDSISGWYNQLGQNLINDYNGLKSFSSFLNNLA